jgi:hypothetical protein
MFHESGLRKVRMVALRHGVALPLPVQTPSAFQMVVAFPCNYPIAFFGVGRESKHPNPNVLKVRYRDDQITVELPSKHHRRNSGTRLESYNYRCSARVDDTTKTTDDISVTRQFPVELSNGDGFHYIAHGAE